MARPPRLQLAGGVFHVMARGVRKQPIFCDLRDFELFLGLLTSIVERHGWRVRAYCLMSNHFHLLIETPDESLSTGMHRLNGGYAQWFNEQHDVEGHVFERRFTSILVEAEPHLLELLRYIVLNPVRAGLCAHPGEWRWSSDRRPRAEASIPWPRSGLVALRQPARGCSAGIRALRGAWSRAADAGRCVAPCARAIVLGGHGPGLARRPGRNRHVAVAVTC